MNILITGAHGFLGKHLTQEIATRITKSGQQYNFYMPRSHEMNCLDYQDFHDFVEKNYVDAVIHLAAQCGGIGANKEKPGDFFLNNAIMGINLLKIAKTLKLKKVLTLGITGKSCEEKGNDKNKRLSSRQHENQEKKRRHDNKVDQN